MSHRLTSNLLLSQKGLFAPYLFLEKEKEKPSPRLSPEFVFFVSLAIGATFMNVLITGNVNVSPYSKAVLPAYCTYQVSAIALKQCSCRKDVSLLGFARCEAEIFDLSYLAKTLARMGDRNNKAVTKLAVIQKFTFGTWNTIQHQRQTKTRRKWAAVDMVAPWTGLVESHVPFVSVTN